LVTRFLLFLHNPTDIKLIAAGMSVLTAKEATTTEAGLYRGFIHAVVLTCDRNYYSDGNRGGGRSYEDSGRC
jgi:hypothetical protein